MKSKKMQTTKRRAIVAGILTSVVMISACGSSGKPSAAAAPNGKSSAGQVLRVAAYSQTTMAPMVPVINQLFHQQTGATIAWTYGSPTNYLAQLVASKGSAPPYDVAFLDSTTLARAVSAGVMTHLDYAKIGNASSLPPQAKSAFGVAWIYDRYGNCYNTGKFASAGLAAPTSVSSWFDPRLAGHVALPSSDSVFWEVGMLPAAQSLGLPLSDPSSGAKKFAAIRGVSLYSSSAQLATNMASGNTWLAGLWIDGQCNGLAKKGSPVKLAPLNISIAGKTYSYVATTDDLTIPKGGGKRSLAYTFIDDVLTAKALSAFSETYLYTPTLPSALALLEKVPSVAPYMYTGSAGSLDFNPSAALNQYVQPWVSAWTAAFGG